MGDDAAAPGVFMLSAIRAALDKMPVPKILQEIGDGFVSYSKGEVCVAPIQTLGQPPLANFVGHPDAQACIKSGYIAGGEKFVVKIASGGGGMNSGLVMVWSQRTFEPEAILLDEGELTEVRTAAAGAVAAQLFAPADLSCIAMIGCGVQARWQLRLLASVVTCRTVRVWSRRADQAAVFATEMANTGWAVEVSPSAEHACSEAGLVICATPAREPLVQAAWLRRRDVLVTAIGADSSGKQELDPAIFTEAGLVVVDARAQCVERGDLQHAVKAGVFNADHAVEIGAWLARDVSARTRPAGLVVFDATGVAVQDVKIAELILAALTS
mmetsp:Transcript_24903/g.59318  ORF Transcript_24903/g.59318 Transcript_24903/m.59318 type:complete len:327 (+) Transcript_24903:22-1002(+)